MPPMPTRCIHSRSAVMPSCVTLPLIQCHHARGFAESGGVLKSLSIDEACWPWKVELTANKAKHTDFFKTPESLQRVINPSNVFEDWIGKAPIDCISRKTESQKRVGRDSGLGHERTRTESDKNDGSNCRSLFTEE